MLYAFLIEDGFNHCEAMEWILSELSEAHINLLRVCLMKTEAKEMYHKLMKKENMTRKKALDRIEKKLSAKHRNLYESNLKVGDMKTEAKEMYHELMKDENMTREKALERIEKDLSVKHRKLYEGLYKGALKTNDMKTEAKEMYHKLMKEESMTREQALDRIEKKLSVKHRNLYEGSLTDMKTEAKEMFDELMKEEGMTRQKALDQIEKKLSVKHRNLYEGCLKPEMDVERYTQLIAECDKQIQENEAKNRSKAKNQSGKKRSETENQDTKPKSLEEPRARGSYTLNKLQKEADDIYSGINETNAPEKYQSIDKKFSSMKDGSEAKPHTTWQRWNVFKKRHEQDTFYHLIEQAKNQKKQRMGSKPVPTKSLPAGWTSHVDDKSGKTFYYNKEQKKSTWVLPETI